eukprot:s19_g15.t1
MPSSSSGGYAEPSSVSDVIDIQVLCLNGEGCMLKLSPSHMGWEVYQMISKHLPPKKGAKPTLHHLDSQLVLHQTLQEQGIVGKVVTLSCTYVPTDLYAAWCTIQGSSLHGEHVALEGVVRIKGVTRAKCLQFLPQSLQHLTFGGRFNQSLEQVTLPSTLQSLTFGYRFNQSLEQVTLPSTLQSLTFGYRFNQSLEQVTLPSTLQSLTLSYRFNQSLEQVTLPSNLQSLTFGHDFNQSLEQSLTFGYRFNQSLEQVTLPSNLQSLTFGYRFNQSLEQVTLPSNLQSLTFGYRFNQSLEQVTLPSNLQSLTFGDPFNQSLEQVTLPSNLQSLTFGHDFNQSLEQVTLPSNLQSLTFGGDFNQSLEQVTLPSNLQSLTFGYRFNQSLEQVTLPSNLQSLTFGCDFNQSLEQVTLPSTLQSLTFGYRFNQSLEQVTLPSNLQSLTFGHAFNQSLEQVTLPSTLQSLTFGGDFNQSLEQVTLPSTLQSLTFGGDFNQSLEQVTLPSNLQSLTFGHDFNQSLEQVTLPSNLQSLTFGDPFNQSLEQVTLPSTLQSLTFGYRFNQSDFNQSLEQVTLPSTLQNLTLGVSCYRKFTEGASVKMQLRTLVPLGLLWTFSQGEASVREDEGSDASWKPPWMDDPGQLDITPEELEELRRIAAERRLQYITTLEDMPLPDNHVLSMVEAGAVVVDVADDAVRFQISRGLLARNAASWTCSSFCTSIEGAHAGAQYTTLEIGIPGGTFQFTEQVHNAARLKVVDNTMTEPQARDGQCQAGQPLVAEASEVENTWGQPFGCLDWDKPGRMGGNYRLCYSANGTFGLLQADITRQRLEVNGVFDRSPSCTTTDCLSRRLYQCYMRREEFNTADGKYGLQSSCVVDYSYAGAGFFGPPGRGSWTAEFVTTYDETGTVTNVQEQPCAQSEPASFICRAGDPYITPDTTVSSKRINIPTTRNDLFGMAFGSTTTYNARTVAACYCPDRNGCTNTVDFIQQIGILHFYLSKVCHAGNAACTEDFTGVTGQYRFRIRVECPSDACMVNDQNRVKLVEKTLSNDLPSWDSGNGCRTGLHGIINGLEVLPTTQYVPIDGSPTGVLNELNCDQGSPVGCRLSGGTRQDYKTFGGTYGFRFILGSSDHEARGFHTSKEVDVCLESEAMSALECLHWRNFNQQSDELIGTEGKSGVPRYDGEAAKLAEYFFRVKMLEARTKAMDAAEVKKLGLLGLRLVEGLRSQALQVAKGLDMNKLATDEGPAYLVDMLYKAFRPRRDQEARELYNAGALTNGVLATQPTESMTAFCLRRRTGYSMLRDLDDSLQLPDNLLAEQPLACAGLS